MAMQKLIAYNNADISCPVENTYIYKYIWDIYMSNFNLNSYGSLNN